MKTYCFYFVFFLPVIVNLSSLSAQSRVRLRDSIIDKATDTNLTLDNNQLRDTVREFSLFFESDTLLPIYEKLKFQLSDLDKRDASGVLKFSNDYMPFNSRITFMDTIIFDPAFLPVVFDGRIFSSNLNFLSKTSLQKQTFQDNYHLIDPKITFEPALKQSNHVFEMRKFYYTNNPTKVNISSSSFDDSFRVNENFEHKKNKFQDLIKADDPISFTKPEVDLVEFKKRYWQVEGDHSLQVSQNKFSKNWGGSDNFNLYSNHKINLNFRKNKMAFNNLVEWRLNLQQNEGDTLHNVTITDDLFRTYTTFSIDAFKKWSYSTNLEMKSSLFNSYEINTDTKIRAFLTPFELNLGIGMRYNYDWVSSNDKHRKFKLTGDISALSLKYVFAEDGLVDRTRFGIEAEKQSKTELGSALNVTLTYNWNKYTNFSSRLKYFTNYEKVYVESENTVNFTLNRYLSTTLYFYLKYDDSLPIERKDRDLGYFMYNEMLRFGLTYKW